jgi:hypothetical protein
MHTIQLILIQADSAEDAFSEVASQLYGDTPSWSDWHNASDAHSMNFAGRWENDIFITDEQRKQIEEGTLDRDTIPNHLCYADDQELADKIIAQFLNWRKEAMKENLTPTTPTDFEKLIKDYNPATNDLASPLTMDLWKLRKLLELLGDDWTYESAIYDLTYYSASLRNFYERCAKNPEKQFLIPVDFHH